MHGKEHTLSFKLRDKDDHKFVKHDSEIVFLLKLSVHHVSDDLKWFEKESTGVHNFLDKFGSSLSSVEWR